MLTLPSLDLALIAAGKTSEVISSFTMVPAIQKRLEPVGAAYEKVKAKVHKQVTKFESANKRREESLASGKAHKEDSESEASEEEVDKSPVEANSDQYEKKRHRRTREEIEKEVLLMGDLYSILELEHLTYEAGEGDIKSAYKRLALMYHPDKLGENISDSDKEIWLKIHSSYETLIDPAKRKRYDSSLPFNDVIPAEADLINISTEKFFALFEPVFKRNAIFAKKKPVPNIGDENTPMD